MGGYIDAPVDATAAWYRAHLNNLRLIEVRGQCDAGTDPGTGFPTATKGYSGSAGTGSNSVGTKRDGVPEGSDAAPEATEKDVDESGEEAGLPATITLKDGRRVNTHAETIARKANGKEWDSHFVCAACGTPQDFRLSVQRTRRTAPVMAYAIQAYDKERDGSGTPYGGRYFAAPSAGDVDRMIAAEREWASRKDADLNGCWPREEMPFTYMTHQANFALPEQGYTHWYKMFNPRQLMVHATLLKAVVSGDVPEAVKHQALGAVQQYLRNQNGFCIWDIGYDKLAPFFSNSNYAPKERFIENCVFHHMGRSGWSARTRASTSIA